MEKSLDKREENPFEDKIVAEEWINSVENERDFLRDKEIYPLLKNWAQKVHARTIVEIGAGQGICADKVQVGNSRYIGIEPSPYLIQRAKELYSAPNREFVQGNAYELPLPDGSVDAAFSVSVWFHLSDLKKASQELARILIPGGHFLIITANPSLYHVWESFYYDHSKDSDKIEGKVNIPVNPLSRSIFYLHTLEKIKDSLEQNGFKIEGVTPFGRIDEQKDEGLFIAIEGYKNAKTD